MDLTTTCNHDGTGRLWQNGSVSCWTCKTPVDPKEVTYGIRDRNLDPCGGGTDLDRVTDHYLTICRDGDDYGEAPFALFRHVHGERPVMLYWNGEPR